MHNVSTRLNWYDREQLGEYKLRVPGYRRLWERNSPINDIGVSVYSIFGVERKSRRGTPHYICLRGYST